ncbi:hypothetical protein Adt_36376 [Abeliophyllum distichum]|uniref:Senescence regulator n=1 Tax=Abeliophyllum distichum TaxID=126358 RepID=A0ABD1QHE4_9LAMI
MEAMRGGLSRCFSLSNSKAEVEDDIGELQEEDVWYNSSNSKPKENQIKYSFGSGLSTPFAWAIRPIPTASKAILTANSGGGAGGGGDRQELTPTKVVASRRSAPIRVPDWSKIYQIKPKKELWDNECDLVEALIGIKIHTKIFDFVEPGDDGGEFIPPHEILARREAGNRCISHSMCEGIGRTLKGRDLTRMRNAVLRITGYIEA